MKISVTLWLDTRRKKLDGKYPLKVSIFHNGKKKRYGLGLEFTIEEYAKLHTSKKMKQQLDAVLFYRNRAEEVVEKIRLSFSFEKFESLFYSVSENKQPEVVDVFTAFNNYIIHLKKNNQIRTSLNYQCALSKLKSIHLGKTLSFSAITPQFLKNFEETLLNEGRSYSTVGIYTRYIRRIFNVNKISGEAYPFGSEKFTPPTANNVKKALSLNDIKKIYDYIPASQQEAKARDLWLFSYFCNGMNFKDIAMLKWSSVDFDNKEIHFYRAKTQKTKRNKIKINVVMNEDIDRIIKNWGSRKTEFVFGYLKSNSSEDDVVKIINQLLKTTNKYLGKISSNLSLSRKVTTNYAQA